LRDLFGAPPAEASAEQLAAAAAREKERQQAVDQRRSRLESLSWDSDLRCRLLEELHALDESDRSVLLELVFAYAARSDWPTALSYCRMYRQRPGRENAESLTAGWMEGVLAALTDEPTAAEPIFDAYVQETQDPWHTDIGRCLLGRLEENTLFHNAKNRPELLLTAHTALGFWNEAADDPNAALRHYKEALSTYLDDWPHFFFAMARMQQLRQKE
jgi:hypothetical protein